MGTAVFHVKMVGHSSVGGYFKVRQIFYLFPFHLPDTMDVLDCMTDFSPKLFLIKHNLGDGDKVQIISSNNNSIFVKTKAQEQ